MSSVADVPILIDPTLSARGFAAIDQIQSTSLDLQHASRAFREATQYVRAAAPVSIAKLNRTTDSVAQLSEQWRQVAERLQWSLQIFNVLMILIGVLLLCILLRAVCR